MVVTDRCGLRIGMPLTWNFGLLLHYWNDKPPGRQWVNGVPIINFSGRAPSGNVRIAWL